MKPPLCVVVLYLLVPVAGPAAADDRVEKPGATVEFRGIERTYAEAMARLVEAVRHAYARDFGAGMPDRVVVRVDCDRSNQVRLFNDGADRVMLSLESPDQLRKPSETGLFHIYGVCHELGHIAMYRTLRNRDWLSADACEGWAHYAGSVMVDTVYDELGPDLWPDKYDYRQDGTRRLDQQLGKDKPDGVVATAGRWRELDKLIGRKNFGKLFAAWNDATIMPADPGAGVLQAAMPMAKDSDRLKRWIEGFAKDGLVKVEASRTRKRTIAAARLSGEPLTLKHDDGSAEGKKSIAGSGHIVRFASPRGGEFYLTHVDVFAARYGAPQPPREDFTITLCDPQLKPIASWKKPYATIERGEPKWYAVAVPPTAVPREFAVCLSFQPTATRGVFVHRDDSSSGHSLTGLPGRGGDALADGEWMIRVRIDSPRSADALRP